MTVKENDIFIEQFQPELPKVLFHRLRAEGPANSHWFHNKRPWVTVNAGTLAVLIYETNGK